MKKTSLSTIPAVMGILACLSLDTEAQSFNTSGLDTFKDSYTFNWANGGGWHCAVGNAGGIRVLRGTQGDWAYVTRSQATTGGDFAPYVEVQGSQLMIMFCVFNFSQSQARKVYLDTSGRTWNNTPVYTIPIGMTDPSMRYNSGTYYLGAMWSVNYPGVKLAGCRLQSGGTAPDGPYYGWVPIVDGLHGNSDMDRGYPGINGVVEAPNDRNGFRWSIGPSDPQCQYQRHVRQGSLYTANGDFIQSGWGLQTFNARGGGYDCGDHATHPDINGAGNLRFTSHQNGNWVNVNW